jgi:hypothetical protein
MASHWQPPPAPPKPSNVGKILIFAAVSLGGLALVVAMIVADLQKASLDPVAEMKTVDALATKLAALAPKLPAGRTAPTACPARLTTPPKAADGGADDVGGAPIIDARELERFAPLDGGAPPPFTFPKDQPHLSDRYMKDFKPWQPARFDRDAHLSAAAAEHFKGGWVVVIDSVVYTPAHVDRALLGTDTFTPGRLEGIAIVFDLEHAEPLCRTRFQAESSADVKWRQGESYVEEAVRDNLETNAMRAAWTAVVEIAPALSFR